MAHNNIMGTFGCPMGIPCKNVVVCPRVHSNLRSLCTDAGHVELKGYFDSDRIERLEQLGYRHESIRKNRWILDVEKSFIELEIFKNDPECP